MKGMHKIKSNINHSSDGVKDGRCHSASTTVTRAGANTVSRLNSIRGVINKNTPRTASLVLLPSLAVLAMFMAIFTAISNNVYAEDDGGADICGGESCSPKTSSTTFSVQETPTLTVGLSSEAVSLPTQPTATGQFGRTSMTVNVTTNNEYGYTLTMQASTDTLTRSTQVNNTTYTIPSITNNITCTDETDTTCNNFTSGYWGYRIGTAGAYLPITSAVSTALAINSNNTFSAATQPTTIYFGAKLDNTKPVGSYEGVTLTFVATTNPEPVLITNRTYLQDFAGLSDTDKTTLLASMTENTVYQKVDNRDNKTYNIAKLADGNIWMLDNLALDLTTVSLDKLKGNTNATDTSLGYLKNGGGSGPYSQSAVAVGMGSDYNKPYIYTALITEKGDVTNQWGSGSHEYGILYNYCAVSAGSYCYGIGAGAGNASEDICPAGWRIPTGNSSGEYNALRTKINNNTASNASSLQALLSTPLSGYFYDRSLHSSQGMNGYFWSSTRGNGNEMYNMVVDATGTDASDDNLRRYGYAARCIFAVS